MPVIDPLLSKFNALIDQQGRMMKVDTALPALALIPERMVMRESVGQPFELVLDCLSTSVGFCPFDLQGEQISLRLLQADGQYRPWHGYVAQAGQLGSDGGLVRFRAVMVPWLMLLNGRGDNFVFQDQTAQGILEDIFTDYPAAHYRFEVTQRQRVRSLCTQYGESDLAFVHRLIAEEGWSYRFEHLDGEQADNADAQGHARHVLVIHDREATLPDLGPMRFTSQHATARQAGQRDAITAFMAQRTLLSNAVTLGSWNYKALSGTTAQEASSLPLGEVPRLEVYDGAGAYRYEDAALAAQAASLALAATALDTKRFEGQGSARHFSPGHRFSLTDHPLYSGGPLPVAPLNARQRPDNAFTLLAVEHHATNNLSADIAPLLGSTELERGTYRNHFHCAPAASAVVPRLVRKPIAPAGGLTALVVGLAGEPITTDRDHRVKLQFAWQRGTLPNPGGEPHGFSSDAIGNAPGNERSGTWVRVALPSAGANWGAVFTPRIGSEVAVSHLEGDIDRPVVTGQVYNGRQAPPFAAGVDSGINHAGVISGLHTHRLDAMDGGGDFNQWVVDDATGQLRMRLLSSYTHAELSVGHLIQQTAHDAQRGAWRGAGFEAGTQGWATLRGGKGLLISSTARPGSGHSAESTQMDAAEAVAQLKAARELGQRLGEAARQARAHPQTTHDDGQAVDELLALIDPARQGKHPAAVNGQAALKAAGGARALGDEPVEAFAQPVVVLDTPSAASLTTEASMAGFAGEHFSVVAQGDWHQSAAHTHAVVAGQTASLHTHAGGIKAFAAHGPVSLRAHTDELHMLADREVTVISVNDEIRIQAQSQVEFVGGQSSLLFKGGDITFTCPGQWSAKSSLQAFLGGGSNAAQLSGLPDARVGEEARWLELELRGWEALPLAGTPYVVTFEDGSTRRGVLDSQGFAHLDGVPKGATHEVVYENPPITVDPEPYSLDDLAKSIKAFIGA